LKHLGKNYEILLDGGCGNGIHSEIFLSKASWIIGLDIAGHDLAEYRKHLKDKASCVKASLEYLPFRQEVFDCVVLQDVLEHTRNPLKVLRQIECSLRPGGELILTVPNWYNRFIDLNPYTVELHHSFHSSIGWKKILERAELKICLVSAILFPFRKPSFLARHLHFFGAGVFLKAKKHNAERDHH
jgi:2-polyprenyl-3-methyl-5-hydroxy-6-metoxy-1,4-benzoquinol methylase